MLRAAEVEMCRRAKNWEQLGCVGAAQGIHPPVVFWLAPGSSMEERECPLCRLQTLQELLNSRNKSDTDISSLKKDLEDLQDHCDSLESKLDAVREIVD